MISWRRFRWKVERIAFWIFACAVIAALGMALGLLLTEFYLLLLEARP